MVWMQDQKFDVKDWRKVVVSDHKKQMLLTLTTYWERLGSMPRYSISVGVSSTSSSPCTTQHAQSTNSSVPETNNTALSVSWLNIEHIKTASICVALNMKKKVLQCHYWENDSTKTYWPESLDTVEARPPFWSGLQQWTRICAGEDKKIITI